MKIDFGASLSPISAADLTIDPTGRASVVLSVPPPPQQHTAPAGDPKMATTGAAQRQLLFTHACASARPRNKRRPSQRANFGRAAVQTADRHRRVVPIDHSRGRRNTTSGMTPRARLTERVALRGAADRHVLLPGGTAAIKSHFNDGHGSARRSIKMIAATAAVSRAPSVRSARGYRPLSSLKGTVRTPGRRGWW